MKVTNKIKAIKEVKSYGHLTLRSNEIPAVKDLQLGDGQKLTITVDVTELRKPDQWDISEGRMKATDIIVGARIMKVESIDTKADTKKS